MPASAAPPAAAVASQQAAQSALVSLLADPLANAWQLLDVSNPSTMDSFIQAIKALTHHFGLVSGTEAAKAYGIERKASGINGSFTARPAPTADPAKVESSIRWATKDLWTPNPDIESAQSLVAGVTEKNILDTGRMTIIDAVHSDRKARGWARETEPEACSFCLLLATRGAVYGSEHSADFQSHNSCRCFAAPVFGEFEPTAEIRHWQSVYKDVAKTAHGPKATRKAFRDAVDASRSTPPQ